jgi:hypothetical protein
MKIPFSDKLVNQNSGLVLNQTGQFRLEFNLISVYTSFQKSRPI